MISGPLLKSSLSASNGSLIPVKVSASVSLGRTIFAEI